MAGEPHWISTTQTCTPFIPNTPYQRCPFEGSRINAHLETTPLSPVIDYQPTNQSWSNITHDTGIHLHGMEDKWGICPTVYPSLSNTPLMLSSLPPPPPRPPPHFLGLSYATNDLDTSNPPESPSALDLDITEAATSVPVNSVSNSGTPDTGLHGTGLEKSICRPSFESEAYDPPEWEETNNNIVVEKAVGSSRECSTRVAYHTVHKGERNCQLRFQQISSVGSGWSKPSDESMFNIYNPQMQKCAPDPPFQVWPTSNGACRVQEDAMQDKCGHFQWRQAIMEARAMDLCSLPQETAELNWAATVDNIYILPCQQDDLVKCQQASGILLLEKRWFLESPITETTALFFCITDKLENMVRGYGNSAPSMC